MYVIDGNTNTIIKEINVGYYVNALTVNSDTNTVYAAITFTNSGEELENQVYVIDGNSLKVKEIIRVGTEHSGIDVNPNTNLVYVSNAGTSINNGNTISIIDGNSNQVIGMVDVGKFPKQISINSDTNTIYVHNLGSKSISIIDGNSHEIISTLDIGKVGQRGFTVNPITDSIYITHNNEMLIIDEKTNEISKIQTTYENWSALEALLNFFI